jgi:hypothetical protein
VRAHKAVSVRGAVASVRGADGSARTAFLMGLPAHGIPWTISGAIPRSPMEASLAAVPDGMTLPQWQEAHDIGQSTAYSLLRLVERMGIQLTRMRIGNATKPSVLLEGQSLEAMNRLLARYASGVSIKTLTAEIEDAASSIQQDPAALPAADEHQGEDANDAAEVDPDNLLMRLQAAQLAQETGMPLTKREVKWILGSSPTVQFSANAPIRIQKHSSLGWSLLRPED